jgi:hypothetical protein
MALAAELPQCYNSSTCPGEPVQSRDLTGEDPQKARAEMKKSMKRLVVARETLRSLDLGAVFGGDTPTVVLTQCTCPELKPERVQ